MKRMYRKFTLGMCTAGMMLVALGVAILRSPKAIDPLAGCAIAGFGVFLVMVMLLSRNPAEGCG